MRRLPLLVLLAGCGRSPFELPLRRDDAPPVPRCEPAPCLGLEIVYPVMELTPLATANSQLTLLPADDGWYAAWEPTDDRDHPATMLQHFDLDGAPVGPAVEIDGMFLRELGWAGGDLVAWGWDGVAYAPPGHGLTAVRLDAGSLEFLDAHLVRTPVEGNFAQLAYERDGAAWFVIATEREQPYVRTVGIHPDGTVDTQGLLLTPPSATTSHGIPGLVLAAGEPYFIGHSGETPYLTPLPAEEWRPLADAPAAPNFTVLTGIEADDRLWVGLRAPEPPLWLRPYTLDGNPAGRALSIDTDLIGMAAGGGLVMVVGSRETASGSRPSLVLVDPERNAVRGDASPVPTPVRNWKHVWFNRVAHNGCSWAGIVRARSSEGTERAFFVRLACIGD